MDSSTDTETHHLGSMTEGAGAKCELRSPGNNHKTDSGIISVQLLEFKARLLEAVEELHIHRDAEKRHEAQICKLVLEKQELEWQKASLQSQIDKMADEHSESLVALKKQFQDQLRGIEGEKGKHQLSAEMKDKEITSLKEELKLLQLFKYSLEKKLSELEQKLQLHTQVKDRHLNQLGEVEKRFGAVSKQFAMVKQTHEKLEQNVEEAMQLNKKYLSFIKKQESTIAALKKDVERLNSELVKCKVSSVCRSGEESSNWLLKEQQLQELRQRLTVETELNKKLRTENAVERAERQGLLSSLQHAQHLLQAQTQALSRTEQQLLRHTEEFQVLKGEHELIQNRKTDKEDKLMQLMEEYKNSQITLENEIQTLRAKMQADQGELKATRDAYDHLLEKHHQQCSCVMHQDTDIQDLESGKRNNFNIQEQSPNSLKCHIDLDIAGNLSKDASLDTEGSEVSSHNRFEQMRHRKETEDIPDERTVECQGTAKDGSFYRANSEVNVGSKRDENVILPSQGPDLLVMGETGRLTDMLSTNKQKDPAVRQEPSVGKSVPVLTTFDNGCSSTHVQRYTDGFLAKLSEPETRSVYGVASDPVVSETRARPEAENLGVSEMQEHQTSDKHASKTFQGTDSKETEPKTTAPEIRLQSISPNNSKMTGERPALTEECNRNPVLQDNNAHRENQAMHKLLDGACLSPRQQSIPQQSDSLHVRIFPGACHGESSGQLSQPPEASLLSCGSSFQQQALGDTSSHFNTTEAKSVLEAPGSHSQSNVAYTLTLAETPNENRTEGIHATAMSAQTLSEQNGNKTLSPQVSNPHGSCSPSARLTKPSEQQNDSEKQIIGTEPSYTDDSLMYNSSFKLDMNPKETLNVQLKSSKKDAGVSSRNIKMNPSASSNPSVSVQKPTLPSGFQEVLEPLCSPSFPKHKQRNRGTAILILPLNKSNIHPDQENAIKQTFSETSAEKESRVPISFGSAQPGSPAVESVGDRQRQNCLPPLPVAARVQGDVAGHEHSTPAPPEKRPRQHSDIRAQITKIEQFLASEGFKPPKRCRIDESQVLTY